MKILVIERTDVDISVTVGSLTKSTRKMIINRRIVV